MVSFLNFWLNQFIDLIGGLFGQNTGLGTNRQILYSAQDNDRANASTNARQARYKKQFHKLIVYIDGRYMASDSVKCRLAAKILFR